MCTKISYEFLYEIGSEKPFCKVVFWEIEAENEPCKFVVYRCSIIDGVECYDFLFVGVYKGLFTVGDATDIFAKFYTE